MKESLPLSHQLSNRIQPFSGFLLGLGQSLLVCGVVLSHSGQNLLTQAWNVKVFCRIKSASTGILLLSASLSVAKDPGNVILSKCPCVGKGLSQGIPRLLDLQKTCVAWSTMMRLWWPRIFVSLWRVNVSEKEKTTISSVQHVNNKS